MRADMEQRFGADFSGVRIHNDGESAQLNRALSAQAFTQGRDIYMGAGQYNPGSASG
ncbi:MAG: flagellar motor protein MotB, partial [Chloroflexota bacterium]